MEEYYEYVVQPRNNFTSAVFNAQHATLSAALTAYLPDAGNVFPLLGAEHAIHDDKHIVIQAASCEYIIKPHVIHIETCELFEEIVISGKTSICVNEETTLTPGHLGGKWETLNPDTVMIANPNVGEIIGLQAGTARIRYSVEEGNCRDTAYVTITVNALPQPPALKNNADTMICSGEIINVEWLTTLLNYDDATESVEFYEDDDCTIPFSDIATDYSIVQSHTVYAIARNKNTGCATILNNACVIVILVKDKPMVGEITIPETTCLGDSIDIVVPTVDDQGSEITEQGWQMETQEASDEFVNITLPYTVFHEDYGKTLRYYAINSCDTTYSNYVTINRCTTTLIGTVFPFVHWNDIEFDPLFTITVNLKSVPNPLSADPLGDLINETPLYSTTAIYYNGTIFVPDSPEYPGVVGAVNNYGLPVDFLDAIDVMRGAPVTPILLETEAPRTYNGQTLGLFIVDDVFEDDYILEIKRDGFVTRWAKITVVASEPQQYLGHRELIPGDVNNDFAITINDESDMKSQIGGNYLISTSNYDPKYDLNADGKVNQLDLNVIIKFTGFKFYHYEETKQWLDDLSIPY
jgi:hypothetical protein